MEGRITDHRNLDLTKLNLDIFRGKSEGKIIWQPRILSYYSDRIFKGDGLPAPYTGMNPIEFYKALGCSNRIYDYNCCFEKVFDSRVKSKTNKISDLEWEHVIETPVGTVNCIERANTSNSGVYPKKWWITCEEDMKVFIWLEKHSTWKWHEENFIKCQNEWGNLGAAQIYFPRVTIQRLIVESMGTEEAIYALYDYPELVEEYFEAMNECDERFIEVINSQDKIEIINFGDNIHGGLLPPDLFEKYVLPVYKRRNELLHKGSKITHAHWDGDVKPLLKYIKETGLDGIEALTPKPQGDVTLEEMKEAVGDDVVLLDGIAAVLFTESYPVEDLVNQVNRLIELFAPNLVLGISDEMAYTGNIERVKLVGKIVDDYNAKVSQ